MEPTLRPGTVRDAEACGRIGYEAFKAIAEQHGFPPDFPSADRAVGLLSKILTRPDVYSVVAELDGQVVGSNFLWEGDPIAGVGPITVVSTAQNAGIGRKLMEFVLTRANARRQMGVRLVQAAYHNRSLSLYSKLGFQAREPLSILQGPPLKLALNGYHVRKAIVHDLAVCDALCRSVHGHDRHGEIAHAIDDGTATVVEHSSRITGYATGLGFFGHAVGLTNEEIKALVGAAPTFTGLGFLLPTRNMELLQWCLNHGLRIVQPMTLMSLGLYQKPAGSFLPSILY
ncbi:MAG TPA: GNAT family N-acetyltransferase [Nitrospira sp.]|nr:GNAT family N-acetyltransferase [Nitrospira sp.]